MPDKTWILPVGLEFERVLAPLGEGGDTFYLLYSEGEGPVSREARGFAERVRDYLESGPFEVEGFYGVDVLDLRECSRVLKEISTMGTAETTYSINIATSSKIMTLAALYVASRNPEQFNLYYPRAPNYLIVDIVQKCKEVIFKKEKDGDIKESLDEMQDLIKSYEKRGWTTKGGGSYESFRVPVLPMQDLSETQLALLQELEESGGGYDSASKLAESLFGRGGVLGAEKLSGAKSTVSYTLSDLEDWGLVSREQNGRGRKVEITDSGRLYLDLARER